MSSNVAAGPRTGRGTWENTRFRQRPVRGIRINPPAFSDRGTHPHYRWSGSGKSYSIRLTYYCHLADKWKERETTMRAPELRLTSRPHSSDNRSSPPQKSCSVRAPSRTFHRLEAGATRQRSVRAPSRTSLWKNVFPVFYGRDRARPLHYFQTATDLRDRSRRCMVLLHSLCIQRDTLLLRAATCR